MVKFEGTRQLQRDLLVHLGAVSLGFLVAGQGTSFRTVRTSDTTYESCLSNLSSKRREAWVREARSAVTVVSSFDPLDDPEDVTACPVLGTSSLSHTRNYPAAVTSCAWDHVAGVSDPSKRAGLHLYALCAMNRYCCFVVSRQEEFSAAKKPLGSVPKRKQSTEWPLSYAWRLPRTIFTSLLKLCVTYCWMIMLILPRTLNLPGPQTLLI